MKGSWNAQIRFSSIINAKNSTMTPEQAVFGRSLHYTELCNTEDDQTLMSVVSSHDRAWKASQIKTAAKIMLLKKVATDSNLMTRRDDKAYSDIADPDVRPKIKTKKHFPEEEICCRACGEGVEAGSVIGNPRCHRQFDYWRTRPPNSIL